MLHILTSRKQPKIEILGQEAMYPKLAQVCILDDLLDANRVMGQIVNKSGKVWNDFIPYTIILFPIQGTQKLK